MCRFSVWTTIDFDKCIYQCNPKRIKIWNISITPEIFLVYFSVISPPVPSFRGNQCSNVYHHVLDLSVLSFHQWCVWLLLLSIRFWKFIHIIFFHLMNSILLYAYIKMCLLILLINKLFQIIGYCKLSCYENLCTHLFVEICFLL